MKFKDKIYVLITLYKETVKQCCYNIVQAYSNAIK